ncbi:MAG: hypothetical protein D6760_04850, partial [Deltaproteobacteria bacterium]
MTALATDATATRDFLHAVWDGKPDDLWLLIWTLPNKRSTWFLDIDDAADYVESIKSTSDVYMQVALSTQNRGPSKRCPAKHVAAVAGLWADIDFADGEAHKAKNLPPDLPSAMSILAAVGLQPTIVVHTGHGLQAWWLLKEPLVVESDEDREGVIAAAKRWDVTVQTRAAKFGWHVDSTGDLARVLRVPGTLNHKTGSPKPVYMIQRDGPRYAELSDFEIVAVDPVSPPAASAPTEPSGSGNGHATADAIVATLSAESETFRRLFADGDTSGYPSPSEADLALASIVAHAGGDAAAIDAVIRRSALYRRKWERADYRRRTIARA